MLRLTDVEVRRITMFATNTRGGRLADLELRHRLRAASTVTPPNRFPSP